MDFLTQYFRKLFSWFNLYILTEKIRKNRVFFEEITVCAVPSGGRQFRKEG